MARILTRPLFRKGGLSKTPRPSYRGGGVTAIRPGYRGGGMNGIMSGIVPRRGYANQGFVATTPEIYLEQQKIKGLPYLTLPKIESKTGEPLSPYALTKVINEKYSKVFVKSFGGKCNSSPAKPKPTKS